MSRKKIGFDTSSWKTTNRVAAWNRVQAGRTRRSINAWADKLSRAELTAGTVTLEEVQLESGLLRRIYTHVAPLVEVEAEAIEVAATTVTTTVTEQVTKPTPKRRRKRKETTPEKWRRLSAMRTEMDRLYADHGSIS